MAATRTSPSAERLDDRLIAEVSRRLAGEVRPAAIVTVALSGGIDSVVLLDMLRRIADRYPFTLRALHVNHGLSDNADRWERFCRRHCERRHVEFTSVRLALARDAPSVEARAREQRYRAFASCGAEVIALAHHRDDQAETVLLRLLRGAGVRGLGGMPATRVLAGGAGAPPLRLVRPLLGASRAEIERYARRRRLRWVDDESNANERFARNFIRARVVPMLERRFPGSTQSLARGAEHLAAAAELLDTLARIDLDAVAHDRKLDIGALLALSEPRAVNALRYFLRTHGAEVPDAARTHEMLRQIATARSDAGPVVRLGHLNVRRYRGMLELVPEPAARIAAPGIVWHGARRIRLPDRSELLATRTHGRGLSVARLAGADVVVRGRAGGERIRLQPGGRTRTLKNLLQEARIAPWQRAAMPLVFHGNTLAWVPGVGCAAEYRATAGERSVCFAWTGLAPPPGEV